MSNVADDFNRADSGTMGTCSDGEHSWYQWYGSSYTRIKNNQAWCWRDSYESANYTEAVIAEHDDFADGEIQATLIAVDCGAVSSTTGAHFIARVPLPHTAGYFFKFGNDGSVSFPDYSSPVTDVRIIRYDGTFNVLASKTVSYTCPVTCKAALSGTSLKLYVDGNEELSTTDSNYDTGYVGIADRVYATTKGGSIWDDLTITGLGGGGGGVVTPPLGLFFSGMN